MSQRELNDYDLKRYDRQMIIRGFGEEGQKKLKNTRAFVGGCGGLGSPIAYYLAAAGFGSLVLADMDVVDLSNLNRQILHWDKNIGELKVKSAYEKLAQLNPGIELVPLNMEITGDNVYELTEGCDIILDGMDNFPTRYWLNQVLHLLPQEFILDDQAGVLGTIQVTEAVKVILGIGEPLLNRLLVYDGEYMQFHEIKIDKNPKCPACGGH